MGKIMFAQQAENERIQAAKERREKSKASWELLKTSSLVEAVRFAREKGWETKEVQVKAVRINDREYEYYVEPFERDCSCPGILKYSDYFD
jgi:hypothetical protein